MSGAEFDAEPVTLLAAREEPGALVLVLSTGEELELAAESVPTDLPPLGAELDEDLLGRIRQAAERKKIARRLFALLDRRLQPTARLLQKLTDEGFDRDAVQQILQRMEQQGIHSDRTYAEAWCRDCLLQRSVGRSYLVQKLRGQGVPGEIATRAARDVLSCGREAELAREAAGRKWSQVGPGSDRDERRRREAKVIRFLQGRGFATGVAVAATREAAPAEDR